MRLFLALALVALCGCASIGIGRSYSTPGPHRVVDVRGVGGCSMVHPVIRGNNWPVVKWVSAKGVEARDEVLIRRWASHGFFVIAADPGDVATVDRCHDQFAQTEAGAGFYDGAVAYAGYDLLKGVPPGAEPRLDLVSGGEKEALIADASGEGPRRFSGEALMISATPGASAAEETLQSYFKAVDRGLFVWMRPAARRTVADQDLMTVTTAWLYADLRSDLWARDWFRAGVCGLCDSDRWTIWSSGGGLWQVEREFDRANREQMLPHDTPPRDPREDVERQLQRLPVEQR